MNNISRNLMTPKNTRAAVATCLSKRNAVNPLTNPKKIAEAGNQILREMGVNEENIPTQTIAKVAKKGLTKTQKTIAIVAGAVLATAGALFGIKKAKENTEAQK